MVKCVYCDRDLAPRDAHQRICGWEKRGVGGFRKSGSDVILRERQPEYACWTCIQRLRAGFQAEQETLL